MTKRESSRLETQAEVYTLSPEELRALQLVLVEMLDEVDRICKKRGISYCLIAGTLLGAVRHKGFIPWDDDLDLAMTRAEYEKFRAACEEELDADKYFFQDNTTDPHYRWGYARVRRKNSEFVRIGQEHMKMKTGIFLDIFPVDAVPDFYPLRVLHCFYCFLLRKCLYAEAGMKTGKTAFLRAWYAFLYRLIPAKFSFARLDRLAKRWNRRPHKFVRAYTFPTPNREYGYRTIWYEDHDMLPFESGVYPVPRDWEGYLRFKFGDYMTLPPEDKRHWHPASRFRLPTD